MTLRPNVGINPLPWFLDADGTWLLSRSTIIEASGPVLEAGFDAITIDIPEGMLVGEYAELLDSLGLTTAPGYFGADFHDRSALDDTIERARRHVAAHRELGHDRSFVAANLSPERIARPGIGADADPGRFAALLDGLAQTVDVFRAGGVEPCLHPHVGSWIELESEVEAALDAVPELAFGPDTGHLFWAGMDPAAMIRRYRDRVGSVHLKDSSRASADAARARGDGYFAATAAASGVWRELGNGDVDLAEVLEVLSADFAGWFIIEVDVPELPTATASTRHSGEWARTHLRAKE
jgi:inosose dehydratase